MEYFWYTKEQIPDGVGFKLFGPVHLFWIALFVVSAVVLAIIYKKLGEKGRRIMLFTIAALMVADEIFKHVGLITHGTWLPDYLPLHFCSINIFVALFDSIKPTKITKHFMIIFALPGAVAAILFMSWTKLPLLNFMHIHSATVHILLALYPILCLMDENWKPDIKRTLISTCIYLTLCVPLYFVNYQLNTNFFFLRKPDGIPPLTLCQNLLGSHLPAIPILGAILVVIMYLIWSFVARKNGKHNS